MQLEKYIEEAKKADLTRHLPLGEKSKRVDDDGSS